MRLFFSFVFYHYLFTVINLTKMVQSFQPCGLLRNIGDQIIQSALFGPYVLYSKYQQNYSFNIGFCVMVHEDEARLA